MRKKRGENATAPSELLGFDSQMEDTPAVSGTTRSATSSLIGHDHQRRLFLQDLRGQPEQSELTQQDFTSDKTPRYYCLLATHKISQIKT